MDGEDPRRGRGRRTGLVLGAGGVLGAAWMTGALAAVQERQHLGDLDVVVGTSAGSLLAAALRCGVSVRQLVAYQRGMPAGALSMLGPPDLDCGALPPRPRFRVGSPRLLLTALRTPMRVHPLVAASACLPQGRADHASLRAMVNGLAAYARRRDVPAGAQRPRPITGVRPRGGTECRHGPAPHAAGAAARPRRTWIVAVDYDTGRRVVFGRGKAPVASLADMVAASCSIPGWFRPTMIAGRRYVDGGVRSPASADLLATAGLDEAYVLAPVASVVTGRPRNPLEGLERGLRRLMTAGLMREVSILRAAGTKVTVLTPGPEDLAAMGANLMDASRRREVFETSLRTSARSLPPGSPSQRAAARAG